MKFTSMDDFARDSSKTLFDLYKMFEEAGAMELEKLPAAHTSLVIVDMINGFARSGALKSKRVEDLIPEIVSLSLRCDELGITKLAFADNHTGISPEFEAYPVHCLKDTSEAQVVDEIKNVGGYKLIPKNSTNGFLEEEFQNWLEQNSGINTFIVTGDCTDICVQQFAVTLKTWFNKQNKNSRIIVPINAVDTYDLGIHNGDLTNIMALYNMHINGIEIVAALI